MKTELELQQDLVAMVEKVKLLSKGFTLEKRGVYLWIEGDTFPYRKELKELGLKWAPKKKKWFYDNDLNVRGGTTSEEEQREKYGYSFLQQ